MPINVDRLDEEPEETLNLQEGTQPYKILSFLGEHAEQAFRQSEIAEGTGINRGSVGAVLSRLEARDLVRHKGRYWAIAKDDRLAAYAAQETASSASTTDDFYGEE